MKIRIKIFLLIFVSSLLIFSLVIFYILSVYREYSLTSAKKQIVDYNLRAADLIKTTLEKDLSVCTTISQSLTGYNKVPEEIRDKLNKDVLGNVLDGHLEYISTWMSWELQFIDKDYDLNYGRKRTVVIREEGLLKYYIDTVNTQGDEPGSLYYEAKQTHKNVLSNPYYYKYSKEASDSILETSIAAPIILSDRFAGMVGVDITLKRFWKLIRDARVFESSHMYLLSSKGKIIASSKNIEDKNKLITDLYPNLLKTRVLQGIADGSTFEESFTEKDKSNYYAAFAPVTIGNTYNSWSICLMLPRHFIEKSFRSSFLNLVMLAVFGIVLISAISYLISGKISKSVSKASQVLKNLSLGMINLPVNLKTSSKDEISEMNDSIMKLIQTLQDMVKFTGRIGRGDFSTDTSSIGEDDVLGSALADMQNNLKLTREKEKVRQLEREKLSWVQEGLTELSELLRMSSENLEGYLLSILRYILNYFKAEQGAIFLLNDIDKDHPFLDMRAAYAYDRKKALDAQIEIGEGLVGRCFQEEEVIYMTNIPKGYTFVSSGLGGFQPKCLFLMPLIFEQKAQGVVEIAAFREFEDYELDFLKEVGERIASSVSVTQKNLQTQQFLEQYKNKSMELENVEILLEEKKKELFKALDKAQNRELETSEITDAISYFASVAWINTEVRVISVKDKYLTDLGHSKIDLIRKKQSTLLVIKQQEDISFRTMWTNILEGETQTMERFYIFNDERVKVLEIFKPIIDMKGDVSKILNIALDYGRCSNISTLI